MTDIEELLERASDIPITVDVEADLVRGRSAARRRRVRLSAAAVAATVLVGGGLVAGGHAVGGDDRRAEDVPVADATPAATPTESSAPSPTQPPTPGRSVTATAVDPATLVHTDFFDVAPPPQGWYLVGAQQPYVMYARTGSGADLTGPFKGRLMVLLGAPTTDLPGEGATPLVFDGRTFYRSHDADVVLIHVRDDGDWLSAQYPKAAGFALPDMVAFLDAVQVLPGAMAVS